MNIDYQLVKVLVSGKVQGVWFRQTTMNVALKLSLTGYAKNLSCGKVEVVAVGNADDIATLLSYLQQGPELANVTAVDILHSVVIDGDILAREPLYKGFETL